MKLDFQRFADNILASVKGYVDRATSDLKDRISALEKSSPKDGADGVDGKDGKDGKDGVDGKSFTLEDVRPVLEAELARWELDFERRAHDVLRSAVDSFPKPKDGADGADGADGKDGLSLEHLEIEMEGDRTIVLKLSDGEREKSAKVSFPVVIDRGVYSPEKDYLRGDGTTWGGCFWICQKDSPTGKPGDGEDWRLAVKKGRNGRDGVDGKDGRNGINGKDWTGKVTE